MTPSEKIEKIKARKIKEYGLEDKNLGLSWEAQINMEAIEEYLDKTKTF